MMEAPGLFQPPGSFQPPGTSHPPGSSQPESPRHPAGPSLPLIVPKRLRDELGRLQEQIKVLLGNYKIVYWKLKKDPENPVLCSQLDCVKSYLAHYSQEQNYLLDKVRKFLRDIEDGKYNNKKQEPSIGGGEPCDGEEEEEEEKPAGGRVVEKKQQHTGKQKDKGKARRKPNSWDSSKASTPTDSDEEEEARKVYLEYFDQESGYRGHVEEYDIKCPDAVPCPVIHREPVDETLLSDSDLGDDTLETVSAEKFMLLQDLVTAARLKSELASIELKRKKSLERVSCSYIPEVADKKLRYQSYLQNSLVSAPQLRSKTVKESTGGGKTTGARRFFPFPPPIERMGTRSLVKQEELNNDPLLRPTE